MQFVRDFCGWDVRPQRGSTLICFSDVSNPQIRVAHPDLETAFLCVVSDVDRVPHVIGRGQCCVVRHGGTGADDDSVGSGSGRARLASSAGDVQGRDSGGGRLGDSNLGTTRADSGGWVRLALCVTRRQRLPGEPQHLENAEHAPSGPAPLDRPTAPKDRSGVGASAKPARGQLPVAHHVHPPRPRRSSMVLAFRQTVAEVAANVHGAVVTGRKDLNGNYLTTLGDVMNLPYVELNVSSGGLLAGDFVQATLSLNANVVSSAKVEGHHGGTGRASGYPGPGYAHAATAGNGNVGDSLRGGGARDAMALAVNGVHALVRGSEQAEYAEFQRHNQLVGGGAGAAGAIPLACGTPAQTQLQMLGVENAFRHYKTSRKLSVTIVNDPRVLSVGRRQWHSHDPREIPCGLASAYSGGGESAFESQAAGQLDTGTETTGVAADRGSSPPYRWIPHAELAGGRERQVFFDGFERFMMVHSKDEFTHF